jgi:hypothetical protein
LNPKQKENQFQALATKSVKDSGDSTNDQPSHEQKKKGNRNQ